MSCHLCEQDPCTCQKALTVHEKKPLWLVQYCSVHGCDVRIRVPADAPLTTPICKWCDAGVSRAVNLKSWPAGMPDPALPWPWMTDDEREKKLRLPYWKDRLRQHGETYKPWFRT